MLHNIKRLPLVALGLGYMVLFTVNSFAGEICLRPDPGGAFKFPCDGDFRNSGYCDGLKKVTVKVGEKAWQAWPYKKDKGTLIENIGTKKQLVRIRMGEKDIASFHATIGKSERQCLVRNTLYNTWMMRSCSKTTC